MPKLSIIVPIYEAERYLRNLLDSIIAQTFKDWELILVDDGSKDNSGNICEEYSLEDSRIKVIHKPNGGVSSARNIGIKYARGKFITFVDADDTLKPSFLANFSYDDTLDFEIQGFRLNHIKSPQNNSSVQPSTTKTADLREIYIDSGLLKLTRGPVCKLMKASIIKENNILFPSQLSFGEDAIFVKLYLLHCKGKARSIAADDYIYNDYDNPNSLTHRIHPAQAMYDVAKMDLELYEQIEARWGKMPKDLDADFRRIRTLEFYQSIVLCMKENSRTNSEKSEFIRKAKEGMFLKVRKTPSLPPTYQLIKLCMTLLPIRAASIALRTLLK